jgi:D-alanyl-lipoteichoic acid acyltransferase DltB (MBOAT superfamily)
MSEREVMVAVPVPASAGRAWSVGVPRTAEVLKLLPLVVQLLLALLLVHQYQLENRTLFYVLALATGGFVVHALLPLMLRLPFFVVLSLAGVVVALGTVEGIWLVAIGLMLIGICHLPVSLLYRVGILAGFGGVLAASRGGWLPSPMGGALWPILGSMFMFRLALYLHALKHDPEPPNVWRTLGYFFMLPNVAFPLYPVVDYTAFHRTYFDREPWQIYQTGVQWIVRGLIQLVLYRFVYLFVVNDPAEVVRLGDLVQFLLGTFLLYLRVSGSFHLIIGVLHLFGFRLPETHRLYFLSSSFTDFWRRINIYWKDFMMKLVYYPSFFGLRRFGNTTALVVSTGIVFVATWLLHSYQWFWLRGGFPLTIQDALFWGLLGAVVVVGSLREVRRGRKRSLVRQEGWSAGRAFRTVATFCMLCVLWSLWSTESLGEWLSLWLVVGNADLFDLMWIGALLLMGLGIAGYSWDRTEEEGRAPAPLWRHPAVVSVALLAVLIGAGRPQVQRHATPEIASFVSSLQQPTLNARDEALHNRGYYENLDNPGRLSAHLWAVRGEWEGEEMRDQGMRIRGDFLERSLLPSVQFNFKGAVMTTNQWGMRDQDYSRAKPAGVKRIAILGASYVMGAGVADDETFESVLERRLNENAANGERYEVLNFGVSAYSLLHQVAQLEEMVVGFEPDVVVLSLPAPFTARGNTVAHLQRVLEGGVAVPYPDLEALLGQRGVHRMTPDRRVIPFESMRTVAEALGIATRPAGWETSRKLRLAVDDAMEWALMRAATVARANGAVPVLMGLHTVSETRLGEVAYGAAAQKAGIRVWNLYDVYGEADPRSLWIAPWDAHPNAEGHRMIAERLHRHIQEDQAALQLGDSQSDAVSLEPRSGD